MLSVEDLSLSFYGSPTRSRLSPYLGRNNGTCRPQRSAVRRRSSSSNLVRSYEDVRKRASSMSRCSNSEEDGGVVRLQSTMQPGLHGKMSRVDICSATCESERLLATSTTGKPVPPDENRPCDAVITYKIPTTPDFSFLPGIKDDRPIADSSPVEDWFLPSPRSSHDARSHLRTPSPSNPTTIIKATAITHARAIPPDCGSGGSPPARRGRNAKLKTPKNPWFKLGIPYRAPALPQYDWVREGTFDRSQKKMTADEYLGLCKAFKIVKEEPLPVYRTEQDATASSKQTPRYTENVEELAPVRALDQLPREVKPQQQGGLVAQEQQVVKKTGEVEMGETQGVQVKCEGNEHWHDAQRYREERCDVPQIKDEQLIDIQTDLDEEAVAKRQLLDDSWVDVQKVLEEDKVPLDNEKLVDEELDTGWKATASSITKGWLKMRGTPW